MGLEEIMYEKYYSSFLVFRIVQAQLLRATLAGSNPGKNPSRMDGAVSTTHSAKLASLCKRLKISKTLAILAPACHEGCKSFCLHNVIQISLGILFFT